MLITTECPECHNRYQVQASLRGVSIWCPNSGCRKVFVVKEVSDTPANGGSQLRGSVGDMVPLIDSAPAAPPPPESEPSGQVEEILPVFDSELAEPPQPASDPRSWREPPPVRREPVPSSSSSSARQPPPPPAPAKRPPSSPDWRTDAPPERRPSDKSDPPSTRSAPPSRPAPPPEPPPVRRKSGDSSPSHRPVELPPGTWAPPPVRRPGGDEPESTAIQTTPSSEPNLGLDAHPAPRRRRWLLVPMIVIPVLVLAALGAAGVYVYYSFAQSEDRLAALAQKDFDEGRYDAAQKKFDQMAKKFPESPRIKEYEFLRDYTDLLADFAPSSAPRPPEETLDKVSTFVRSSNPALLTANGRKLGSSLVAWLRGLADSVKQEQISPETLDRGRQVLVQLTARVKDAVTKEERAQFDLAVAQAQAVLKERAERNALMEKMRELSAKGTIDAIREIEQLAREHALKEKDFDHSPEVVALVAQAQAAHANGIKFFPQAADLRPPPAEDFEPGLLVERLVAGQPVQPRPSDPVVVVLVRGVLYGLSQTNGQILWALRVGPDTSRLPLVVPASEGRPEMVLALSADTETLTALDSRTGDQLWQYRLSAACLGQPVLVDMRAYVPTVDGLVHEIELVKGQLIGYWKLGSRLRLGGSLQEVITQNGRERLLYVPADEQCVYVLNVDPNNPHCETVLYTGHPSGSLRGEPILAGPGLKDPQAEPAYLILAQAEGLNAMQLRVWQLPIKDPNAPALPMVKDPQVRGWPWFAPHQDPEKLVLVTDAGVVGLFGIRQFRNKDNPLFSLVGNEVRVGPQAKQDAPQNVTAAVNDLLRSQRAQVALSQGDDLWVLAAGWLQKLSLTFDEKAGPKAVIDPMWKEPLRVGSPLHRSQTDATGSTLFVVTQAPRGNACLATAVDAATKKVLWQRQLGLVVEGTPVVVGGEALALESAGGVLAFDPKQHPRRTDLQWQVGGRPLTKARDPLAVEPTDDAASNFKPWSMLAPGADGVSAYEIVCENVVDKNGPQIKLQVRRFAAGSDGKVVEIGSKSVELASPPAGRPAVGETHLLLPLSDGRLVRVKLPPDASGVESGPRWRPRRQSTEGECYVAWLGPNDFVATNGGRGLTRWTWQPGQAWRAFRDKPDEDIPTAILPARIASAPVALPPGPKGEVRLGVADTDGKLWLLQGDKLQPERHWDLGGRITAGPFLRGPHLGCVVNGRRLVWIDPEKPEPLWKYEGGEIVGQPQLAGKVLVVADEGGKFVGLDPKTGREQGRGYTLKANVAPAAAPVAFGPDQVFAPLTDGTVLLLGTKYLSEPVPWFPFF